MAERERLGRYELVAHLASGGMGRVSVGRAVGPGGFERHVVIKVLEMEAIEENDAAGMFIDEARVLGMLHHQHLASIHEIARDDSGPLFLVLEYVHGHTAQDVWERAYDLGAALPLDFALTVVAAAASGLHYAHNRTGPDGQPLRIVHRDVSLSNLMLGFDGAVKVIDFGIAKAKIRATQTQAGYVKGKLGYMAPEQLRGLAVDARTDVFALGIVLYELSTMKRCFREDSDRETLDNIRAAKLVPPSQVVADYPRELEDIVLKALRVDPADRYQDCEALRRDLEVLGHRYRQVLGDAAIIEVMNQLFDHRDEPWLGRATTRSGTDAEISVEYRDSNDEITQPTQKQGHRHLRAATEILDQRVLGDDQRPTSASGEVPVVKHRGRTAGGSGPPAEPVAPRRVLRSGIRSAVDPAAVVGLASGEQVASGAVRRRRLPSPAWLVPIFVVIATVAVGVFVMLDGGAGADSAPVVAGPPQALRPVAPAARGAPPPPKPKPPAPPPAAAPVRTTVLLTVTSKPAAATVLLDGKRLGQTPLQLELPIAEGRHVLKLRRRGYSTHKRNIELTDDVTAAVTLRRGGTSTSAK